MPNTNASIDEDMARSFTALADQWRRETAVFSSITKKVKHPAYQKIIAMGDVAVPFILAELKARPAHWFAALQAITHTSPGGSGEGSDVKRATAAWLNWGKQHGHID